MTNRVLITGVRGFTGRYLAAELSRAGYEVFGLAHALQDESIPGVSAVYSCDLGDAAGLKRVVSEVQPDVIAHLAAIAFVAHGDVDAIYRTNVMGSRNLLDALCQATHPVRSVLVASSANVYGNATSGLLGENAAVAPANDYAVSKLSMEFMLKLYQQRLPLTLVRPFNYTGRGQSDSFLLPKIISHIRRKAQLIELGNLNVARDFSDVRTVVQYYRRLLELPGKGETYNVCSGQAHTLEQILEMVRRLSGHKFEVRINPAFVRENEVKILVGDNAKITSAVGKVPDIALSDTLAWMLSEDY